MRSTAPLVIFSEKAFLGIYAETYERVGTETGGIFLGQYDQGIFYVLETLDPGPNSIFQPAYFEYDTPYVNHLANKIARFYQNGLTLVGLWHRHPGGFDRFSHTDGTTNIKYAQQKPYGAISAIVNLDPDFRLTVYHVGVPLSYTRVNYQVGDGLIPNEWKELKGQTDLLKWKPPEYAPQFSSQTTKIQPDTSEIESHQNIRNVSYSRQDTRSAENWGLVKVLKNLFWPFRETGRLSGDSMRQKDRKGGTTRDIVNRRSNKPRSESTVDVPLDSSVQINSMRYQYPGSKVLNSSISSTSSSLSNNKATSSNELLLDMIDNEIDYLERQVDYRYTLSIDGEEVVIQMEYIQYMTVYPHHIKFHFGISNESGYYRLNGQTEKYKYQPQSIRNYLNFIIQQSGG